MIRKLDIVSDLIRDGRLRLGMTRQELEAALGIPDEVGGTSRKYQVPSIWKYGDVEFVFPAAKSLLESEGQGLLYVYVDDGVEGVEQPIYLLR
jgi:hypothetical protein